MKTFESYDDAKNEHELSGGYLLDLGDGMVFAVCAHEGDALNIRTPPPDGFKTPKAYLLSLAPHFDETRDEEQLHRAARNFMDQHAQDGWQKLSLDEWLIEYGDKLSEEVRREGAKLLHDFF